MNKIDRAAFNHAFCEYMEHVRPEYDSYENGWIDALAHRDAQQGEPVLGTKTWFEDGKVITQNLTASDIYTAPAQPAQPAQGQQEPVACLVGMKGSAFDTPTTKRAYTYKEQPNNVVAHKLGRARHAAARQRSEDYIDAGLTLLKELQIEGFGVFDLGAEYTTPPAAPDVRELVEALQDILAYYPNSWASDRAKAALAAWEGR